MGAQEAWGGLDPHLTAALGARRGASVAVTHSDKPEVRPLAPPGNPLPPAAPWGELQGSPPRRSQRARRYRSLSTALGLGKRHKTPQSPAKTWSTCASPRPTSPHSLPLLHTTAPTPPVLPPAAGSTQALRTLLNSAVKVLKMLLEVPEKPQTRPGSPPPLGAAAKPPPNRPRGRQKRLAWVSAPFSNGAGGVLVGLRPGTRESRGNSITLPRGSPSRHLLK